MLNDNHKMKNGVGLFALILKRLMEAVQATLLGCVTQGTWCEGQGDDPSAVPDEDRAGHNSSPERTGSQGRGTYRGPSRLTDSRSEVGAREGARLVGGDGRGECDAGARNPWDTRRREATSGLVLEVDRKKDY